MEKTSQTPSITIFVVLANIIFSHFFHSAALLINRKWLDQKSDLSL